MSKLSETEQQALKYQIVSELKECCNFLQLNLGEIKLELNSAGCDISGKAIVEGRERYIPKIGPTHQFHIRMRITNWLIPIADNKWDGWAMEHMAGGEPC